MLTLLLCIAGALCGALLLKKLGGKLLGSLKGEEQKAMAEVVKLETAAKDELKKL